MPGPIVGLLVQDALDLSIAPDPNDVVHTNHGVKPLDQTFHDDDGGGLPGFQDHFKNLLEMTREDALDTPFFQEELQAEKLDGEDALQVLGTHPRIEHLHPEDPFRTHADCKAKSEVGGCLIPRHGVGCPDPPWAVVVRQTDWVNTINKTKNVFRLRSHANRYVKYVKAYEAGTWVKEELRGMRAYKSVELSVRTI